MGWATLSRSRKAFVLPEFTRIAATTVERITPAARGIAWPSGQREMVINYRIGGIAVRHPFSYGLHTPQNSGDAVPSPYGAVVRYAHPTHA